MEDDKVLAELLDKIDNLKELMSNGFVKFSFKKADGTIREATGTLSPSYINYHTFREKEANQTYFVLILKFIILFRECFNNSRSKKADSGLAEGEEASTKVQPETLPELCNEFYTEFMENNEFFGISDEKEKNEISRNTPVFLCSSKVSEIFSLNGVLDGGIGDWYFIS